MNIENMSVESIESYLVGRKKENLIEVLSYDKDIDEFESTINYTSRADLEKYCKKMYSYPDSDFDYYSDEDATLIYRINKVEKNDD